MTKALMMLCEKRGRRKKFKSLSVDGWKENEENSWWSSLKELQVSSKNKPNFRLETCVFVFECHKAGELLEKDAWSLDGCNKRGLSFFSLLMPTIVEHTRQEKRKKDE